MRVGRYRGIMVNEHITEFRNPYQKVKPTGNTLLGRPRCRWADNIRKNLKEIGICLVRLRIDITGEALRLWHLTSRFHGVI